MRPPTGAAPTGASIDAHGCESRETGASAHGSSGAPTGATTRGWECASATGQPTPALGKAN